jgi:hypothetical protein
MEDEAHLSTLGCWSSGKAIPKRARAGPTPTDREAAGFSPNRNK